MEKRLPIISLKPEETSEGTIYHAANTAAETLLKLIGRTVLQDRHLPLIEELRFEIVFPNGQPIPFPRGAYKRPQPEPLHVRDEA